MTLTGDPADAASLAADGPAAAGRLRTAGGEDPAAEQAGRRLTGGPP